ncbi:uncharacterized protein LOC125370412 [Ricinus communis]|uniref:uncharacterized protein LOC125370412 n=1 Tax=Ricinus communis TaxID=3988 RepID=UPI00201AF321|nr:uncharacterized protein LOC125370412 [Ricinus communis]
MQTNTGGQKYKIEVKDIFVVCSHCKREGHDSETCFQLIRYLEWWGARPKGAGGGRGRQSAGRGRSNTPKVNTTHVIRQPSSSIAATKENTASGTLTAEQWSFFLNLLNTCKSGTSQKMNGPYLEDGDWRDEQCKGLYYFKSAVSVKACKTSHVDSFKLWHGRMGHPFEKIMESLPQVEFSNS